ncbi:hypothetical protein QFZ23_002304 [Arthrobacter globiformis]|uniref:hypothetical protein n=1 Tax=Arthrobacter globiformis TaxID=1665 RepID=UPI002782821F|nr:hypothetical protein [Arthrobacter globiformis]MDQ1058403.1 hypothetical protein [Arthrobacter globiformis]
MHEMHSMVTRVLITAAVALVGLTGCSGGTSTADSPAPSTAASVPAVDTSHPAIRQAQSDYLTAAGKVRAAYDTFYNRYDSGSTDLPALQKAAAGVADALGEFGNFVRDYDWPPSVPSDLPATIRVDYTTDEGGMDTWVKVAAAGSLAEMKERLKETDSPEATSDTDTDALRKAIGLPPSVKPSD